MKETGAFFLDFVFTFALASLIYVSVGVPLIRPAFGYQEATDRYNAAAVDSGFVIEDKDGNFVDAPLDTTLSDMELYVQYETVEQRVFDYFTVKIPSSERLVYLETDEFNPKSSSSSGSEEFKIEVGKWVYKNVFLIKEGELNALWCLPSSEEDYKSMPKPSATLQTDMNGADQAKKLAAYRTLYLGVVGSSADDTSCLWSRALTHFKSQPEILAAQEGRTFATYASLYPSIILSPLVFFLMFPLIFKNGQTLGKKICKIALLGNDGYAIKTPALFIHYAILILYFYLFLIPYPLYSFMGFCLILIVDYMVMILSKYHQSLHAMAARTISIDAENSIWFVSKAAEQRYIEHHPSSLAARIQKEESMDEMKKTGVDPVAFEREALGIFDSSTLGQNPYVKKEKEEGKEQEDSSKNS